MSNDALFQACAHGLALTRHRAVREEEEALMTVR